jgi:hypothetical protein
VKVQMQAARTSTARRRAAMQMVIEFAQAGIISTGPGEAAGRHPDLESELSLYTAALETIEYCLDEIADGKVVMPEPYTNLQMACGARSRVPEVA